MVTLTAVRPPARFGALKIKGNTVSYFKEKSKLDEGWINGGFFVMNQKNGILLPDNIIPVAKVQIVRVVKSIL